MAKKQFVGLAPAVWAVIAVLIVVVGLGAYVLGHSRGASTQAAVASTVGTTEVEGPDASDSGDFAAAGKGNIKPVADVDVIDPFIMGPSGDIESEADVLKVHRRNAKDPFAIGAIDAPVVISEFSDFECPYCALYTNGAHKQIVEEYVAKGLVRIEWNDFPINGADAVAAAKAGRAAAAQGKFYEFHDALYKASANIQGHPENKIDDFVRFAEEAGVPDIAKFREQATDGTYDAVIQDAQHYGDSLGIKGTPGAFIGTQFISGAQPIQVFREVINGELVKAKNMQASAATTSAAASPTAAQK